MEKLGATRSNGATRILKPLLFHLNKLFLLFIYLILLLRVASCCFVLLQPYFGPCNTAQQKHPLLLHGATRKPHLYN